MSAVSRWQESDRRMELVRQYEQLWNSGEPSPDVFAFLQQHGLADAGQVLAVLVCDQQRRWRTANALLVEDYLARLPDLPRNIDWKLQLAIGEFQARRETDRPLSQHEISSRFADISDTLRDRLKELTPDAAGLLETVIKHEDGASLTVTYISSSAIGDERKGRYRLDRVLGEGAFGRVYLGFDEELQREARRGCAELALAERSSLWNLRPENRHLP